eukprot:TRINITY_DN1023_c0_g1_i2.p5 TRINITY_DN1023_c0_g1~~TRINITY_DN1023_c0_g1_i2.p5  ORF type:complete len:255 (-),score=-8.95 TRINITY_DN1023_c0_g1_i2:429-1193(-)
MIKTKKPKGNANSLAKDDNIYILGLVIFTQVIEMRYSMYFKLLQSIYCKYKYNKKQQQKLLTLGVFQNYNGRVLCACVLFTCQPYILRVRYFIELAKQEYFLYVHPGSFYFQRLADKTAKCFKSCVLLADFNNEYICKFWLVLYRFFIIVTAFTGKQYVPKIQVCNDCQYYQMLNLFAFIFMYYIFTNLLLILIKSTYQLHMNVSTLRIFCLQGIHVGKRALVYIYAHLPCCFYLTIFCKLPCLRWVLIQFVFK